MNGSLSAEMEFRPLIVIEASEPALPLSMTFTPATVPRRFCTGFTFGNKRFGELQRDISDISPKMLSQELRALEENKIITRTLYDSMPVVVEYSLTPLGHSMKKLLDEILIWGAHFRKEVLKS